MRTFRKNDENVFYRVGKINLSGEDKMNFAKKHITKGISILLNSFFLFYLPSCVHYNSLKPKMQITQTYSPVGNVELDYQKLPQTLNKIEKCFDSVYYGEDGGGKWVENPNSEITFNLETDELGLGQPTILLKSNIGSLEKILSSKIKSVKVNNYLDLEGNRNNSILIYYSNFRKEDKLNYYLLTEYIIPVKCDPNAVALYIKKISEQYVDLKEQAKIKAETPIQPKLEVNKQEVKECKHLERPAYALSIQEQIAICSGEIPQGKEVFYLGEENFANCSYEPSTKGVEEIISNLSKLDQKKSSIDENVILVCGNATESPANKCPSSVKDFGNLELSFWRAYRLAETLAKTSDIENKILMTYPMGISLDKRNADVYLVKNKAQTEAKK